MIRFWDCCFGEEKRLRVVYSFKGLVHECEVGNTEAMILPQKCNIKFTIIIY